MTQVLRLFIPADWPARRTACEWSLVGDHGARLQQGCSEPRHWPQADRCEIVLSADQCLPLQASLPKGAKARTPDVLAYALEDQLIGEAEGEHLVVGDTVANASTADNVAITPVWVVARARLRALIAALQPLGRQPDRLISELQLAPRQTGWSVCLTTDKDDAHNAQRGFVRLAAEDGFAFDLDDAEVPPLELKLALQAAQKNGTAPQAIEICATQGLAFDATTASAWQTALGMPVRFAGEYSWRNETGRDARNLLSGEFLPPRRTPGGWRVLRPAALVGIAGLLLYAGFSFAEWIWLDHQKNRLQQQITGSFRATFPQVQTVVDPVLQMQRLHDQMRRERGQLGSGDFLPLLAAASEATTGQGHLRSIRFEDGRLELVIAMKSAAAAEVLRETLSRRGLTAVLREARPAADGVEAVFTVRGTS